MKRFFLGVACVLLSVLIATLMILSPSPAAETTKQPQTLEPVLYQGNIYLAPGLQPEDIPQQVLDDFIAAYRDTDTMVVVYDIGRADQAAGQPVWLFVIYALLLTVGILLCIREYLLCKRKEE